MSEHLLGKRTLDRRLTKAAGRAGVELLIAGW
jgi:hypothetical protein